MGKEHIEGSFRGDIVLYTLSTCAWCKKTKRFLNELGVDYYFIDIDRLEGEERRKIVKQMKSFNPKGSYPTMVINGSKVIVSFDKDEIMEVLGDG